MLLCIAIRGSNDIGNVACYAGSAENEEGEPSTPRYRPDGIDALSKATGKYISYNMQIYCTLVDSNTI